jgi:hypothetical protein
MPTCSYLVFNAIAIGDEAQGKGQTSDFVTQTQFGNNSDGVFFPEWVFHFYLQRF